MLIPIRQTLFRLPLRSEAQINPSPILQTAHTSDYVRDSIILPYRRRASQSLTMIRDVSTYYRSPDGTQVQGWSLFADRVQNNGEYTSHTVTISGRYVPDSGLIKDEWEGVSTSVSLLEKSYNVAEECHRARGIDQRSYGSRGCEE
jgi:hypothetical protein